MRYLLFLSFFLLVSLQISAQREAANWIFGNNAGLTFNTGNPVTNTQSQINTIESSASISDANGDLLFYTDGESIFNKDYILMQNGGGILGHKSSANGTVIVPDPNNNNLYYVFTSDAVQYYQEDDVGAGFNYSVVDMSLQGGLGAVIEKNTNLLPQGSEKLTAVAKDDGSGYWILTHYLDTFYAYSVTASGISAPVTSTIGPLIDDFNNIRGAIKLSPDGQRLAVAHAIFEPQFNGELYLYDFNNQNGTVSNEQFLASGMVYYGVEFSSNSEVLYSSAKMPLPQGLFTGNIFLYQYDLNSANPGASSFLLMEIESDSLSDIAGALQLAIDCKIYYTSRTSQFISVIRRPNRLGFDAVFGNNIFRLSAGISSIGLPLYVQSYFNNIIEYDDLCSGDMTAFTLNTSKQILSVDWNFDDPSSGADNTSQLISPTHTFSDSGVYDIIATVTFQDGSVVSYTKIVPIVTQPEVLDVTLLQCNLDGGDTGFFNLEEAISLFFDNQNQSVPEFFNTQFFNSLVDAQNNENSIANPTFYESTMNGQIIYTRVDISFDCFFIGQINLVIQDNSNPEDRFREVCDIVGSQEDIFIVVDEILGELEVDFPNLSIRLYTSVEDAISEENDLFVTPIDTFQGFPGLYYRVESELGCLAIGFIELSILETPEIFNEEVILCDEEQGVILSVSDEFNSYLWSTGETTSSITVFETGNYEVVVANGAECEDRATFFVVDADAINITYTINDFQQYNSIVITNENNNPNLLYSIDGGLTFQTSPVFNDIAPGYYNLVVTAEDSCNTINELLLVRGAPRYFTPNNDGYNDFWHVNQALDYQGMEISIFDRFGKLLYAMDYNDRGWDGTYGGVLMPTNAYWYRINYEGAEYYGHFTLIRRR